MKRVSNDRRRLITGLGAAATAAAVSVRPAQAQAAFTPTLHALDDWMSQMPGKHRVVLDVTSPDGLPDAIRFAGNLFTGHEVGYKVPPSEVAIIITLRHGATPYGYNDGLWSKYGRTLDAKAATPPVSNPFDSGNEKQLSALAKRGARFMLCGTASRGISRRIAGDGGNADEVFKEMEGLVIPNARIVPAGVVGVAHAQERGFSLLYVG